MHLIPWALGTEHGIGRVSGLLAFGDMRVVCDWLTTHGPFCMSNEAGGAVVRSVRRELV